MATGIIENINGRLPAYGMGKNLLDNWYFLNPVNQRGVTSGSGAEGYSIDRWKASFGSGGVLWSLTSSGLTFQPTNTSSYAYISQVIGSEILPALTGKKISAYVLTSDGDMIGGVVTYTSDVLIYDANYDGHRVRIRFSGNNLRIESYASALTVCAVKLELGSEQTLCHDEGTYENPVWVLNEIPDYGEELRKCQRYYFSYQIPASQAVVFPGVRGDLSAGTNLGAQIDLPVVMVKTPTVDAAVHSIRGNGSVWNTGLSVTTTASSMYANHVAVEVIASNASFPGLTNGYAVLFTKLNLSAES